jgi:acetolactate synthase-1/2/3 large subunit
VTVADEIAAYLGERCPVAFGIIGAGNAALFDAIARLGKTEIICCHHEQAAVMAAIAYYRAGGPVTAALVTTGAGSSNALTGVLSSFMDSIPVVVIAGNEASFRPDIGRARGVQGYDSSAVARHMTKSARRLLNPAAVCSTLNECFLHAEDGRMGPVWLEMPMDVQACARAA